MPKRIYVGSHQEVALPDGTTCKRNTPTEIPDGIDLKELDASAAWESASPSSQPAKGEKEN